MNTRALTANRPGPVLLDLDVPSGSVKVTAASDCQFAEVIVRAIGDAPPVVRALNETRLEWDAANARLTVRVPESDDTSGVSVGNIDIVGNGGPVIFGNNVAGSLIVNGTQVGAGGSVNPGHLEITVTVPECSGIVSETRAASIEAVGEYCAVQFNSTAGDLSIGGTYLLWANTVSGKVEAEAVHVRATVRSVSGSVRIGRADWGEAHSTSGKVTVDDLGGEADIGTTSGAIDVHATEGARVTARSISGSIKVTASPTALAEGLEVDATSRHGRVTTPNTGAPTTSKASRPRRGGA